MNKINGMTKEDLIKSFRDLVKGGKHAKRHVFLAYSYLRDIEYDLIESKIEQDKLQKFGLFSFLRDNLSHRIARSIVAESFMKGAGNYEDPIRDGIKAKNNDVILMDSAAYNKLRKIARELSGNVFSWMVKKYSKQWFKKIPHTLDDAVCNLKNILPQQSIDKIKSTKENWLIAQTHHSLGRTIRNEWCLWEKRGPLYEYFLKNNIHHPDDMSTIIITCLIRDIKGEERKLQDQIDYFISYWDEVAMNEALM